MIGNPIGWWLSSIAVLLFSSILFVLVVRRKRAYNDFKEGILFINIRQLECFYADNKYGSGSVEHPLFAVLLGISIYSASSLSPGTLLLIFYLWLHIRSRNELYATVSLCYLYSFNGSGCVWIYIVLGGNLWHGRPYDELPTVDVEKAMEHC